MVDGADEATLECNGVETVSEGISSDSGTREKKEKQVILKARIRKDLHKYQANDHVQCNKTQKPCKTPKGRPTGHVLLKGEPLTALVRV